MTKKLWRLRLFSAALLAAAPVLCPARQQQVSRPPERQTPAEREDQAPVKVFTEEVILPIVAYDAKGRFDPTLEADDILVLEDGTPQQVRSVRRVPASILLVFDMGGQMAATRSMNTSRDIALKLTSKLREGDQVAVIQNSTRVELLADWTADADGVARVLKTKLFSSRRSRLSLCLEAAAAKLRDRPVGNSHLFVFTDGLEAQGEQGAFDAALKRIVSTQATAHVMAYSALARQAIKARNGNLFDLDFEMKRTRRRYAEETKRNDERLAALVREMGGRLFVPASDEEAFEQADEAAREIGAQYVVTYAPKRPFAAGGERRRVSVSSRRVGLQLVAMRGYVAPPAVP